MADALGSLAIKVMGDIAEFRTAMQQTRDIAQDTAKKLEDSLAGAANMVKGALIGMVSVGTVMAIYDLARSASQAQAGLQQLSEVTGATVEGLSAIRGIAKLSGTEMEAVGGALNKLAKNVQTGGDDIKNAFEAIGLSQADMKNMKTDEVFIEISKALAGYADGSEKTALAQILMGRSGAQLLPVMRDIADAGDLVAKTTAEQAQQADELEKNIVRLNTAQSAWKKIVGAELVPVLDDVVKVLLEMQTETGGMNAQAKALAADGSIKSWAQNAVIAVAYLVDIVQGLWGLFKSVAIGIAAIAAQTVDVLSGVANAAIAVVKGNYSEVPGIIKGTMDRVSSITQMAGEDIRAAFSPSLVSDKFKEQFAKSADAIANVGGKAKDARPPIKNLGKEVKDAAGTFEDLGIAITKAWAALDVLRKKSETTIQNNQIDFMIADLNRLRVSYGDTEYAIDQIFALEKEKFANTEAGINSNRKTIEEALDKISAAIQRATAAGNDKGVAQGILAYAAEAQKLIPIQEQSAALTLAEKKANQEKDASLQALLTSQGKQYAAMNDAVVKQLQENQALKEATEQIGLTKQGVIDYTIAKVDEKIAMTEAVLATEMGTAADYRALEALKALKDALLQKKDFEGANEALTAQVEAWKSVGSASTAFFEDLIKNGSSAFGNLWKTVKNFFVKLAAEMATKYLLNIAGSLGFSGAAAAANSMGGGGGVAGGALGGAIGGMITAGFSALAGSLIGLGGGIGTAAGVFEAVLAGTGSITSGLYAAGASLVEGSALLSGAAEVLLMIPVWGWVILAIAAIAAFVSKDEKGIKFDNNLTNVANPQSHWTKSAISDFDVSGDLSPQQLAPFTSRVQAIDKYIADHLLTETTLAEVRQRLNNLTNPDWWDLDDKGAVEKASKYFLQQRYGAVFDSLNASVAATIKGWTGTADELLQYVATVSVIDWKNISGNLAAAVGILASTKDGVKVAIQLLQTSDLIAKLVGMDFVKAGAEMFAAQSRTAMDTYNVQADALEKLVDAAKDGKASFTDLANGAAAFAQTAQKTFADILAAKASIDSTAGSAIRGIETTGLNGEEMRAYLAKEIQGYGALRDKATDPTVIASLTAKIIADYTAAYGTLTPEQQLSEKAAYIAAIKAQQDGGSAALQTVQDAMIEKTRNVFLDVKTGLDAVVALMATAAAVQQTSAVTFDQSVNKFGVIVDTPLQIEVTQTKTEIAGGQ